MKASRARSAPDRSFWVFVAPGLVLTALLALPLLAIVWRSLQSDFLSDALTPAALGALRLSLITSFATVAIALVTGTPLAYMLARMRFRGRGALELLVDLPIVLPPSVAGLGLLLAFGRQGLLGSTLTLFGISLPFTTLAVVLAQTFVSAPLYVRAARIGFDDIDPQLEESAYVEGASQWKLFREIMLPLTRRALFGGAVLCLTRALGEFGATLLFAGNLPGRTQTMPLAIYLGFERNLGVALALSLVLVIASVVLLTLMRRLARRFDD